MPSTESGLASEIYVHEDGRRYIVDSSLPPADIHSVTRVQVLGGYRLWVEFGDGERGEVDLADLAKDSARVRELWEDRDYFETAHIPGYGGVAWEGHLMDIDPTVLYMRVTGKVLDEYSKIALASSIRVLQRLRSNSSTCMRAQNDSMVALSKQSPTVPMDGTSPDSRARWVNAQEANWVPWSECITVPGSGWRFPIAIPNAEVTSPEVAELSIDQPTTRRLNTSSTTAQYTLPSRVGCSVMSVTHSWSGSKRAKLRSTRSTGVSAGRVRRLGVKTS